MEKIAREKELLTAKSAMHDNLAASIIVIKQYLSGILFVIDIDGPKGNNIIGKDVFLGGIYFVNNAKFIFYQNGKTNNNNFIPQEYTREELVQGCETDGRFCGTLIQSDGWQIKYKY